MEKKQVVIANFVLLLSILFFSPVVTALETTLAADAPSSVEIQEGFLVTADYESNGSAVCGADCQVSGTWMSYSTLMGQDDGCSYSATIYAPQYADEQTVTVECTRIGYDYASDSIDIDIDKKESTLSIQADEPNPYPGDQIVIYAYYRNEGGSTIYGSCTAKLYEGGKKIDEFLMRSIYSYHSLDLTIPDRSGKYRISVTCTDDEYDSASDSISFDAQKLQATLDLSYSRAVRYGETLKITALYKHISMMIQGSCTYTLDDVEYGMGRDGNSHTAYITMPYEVDPQIITVKCISDRYETKQKTINITPLKRLAEIDIESPVERSFYPTDTIKILATYEDSEYGQLISGALCMLDGSKPLTEKNVKYEIDVTGHDIGPRTFSVRCSKRFYSDKTQSFTATIKKIPIEIKFIETKTEFRPGEDINVKAIVTGLDGLNANASCNARIDQYDLAFNNLINFENIEMVYSAGVQEIELKNPGQPAKMVVSVTCSSPIHEENTNRIEILSKRLNKSTEEGALLILSVTTVILLGLIILIRKKLKII